MDTDLKNWFLMKFCPISYNLSYNTRYESNMEITDSTKTITGVTFGLLYEQMYDDGRRARLTAEIDKFTQVNMIIISRYREEQMDR